MPNTTQRALSRGCRFAVLDPDGGFLPASFHKSEQAARRAAWRFARSGTERSAWSELFESNAADGVQSIGIERESFAIFGSIDATIAFCHSLGLD